MNCQAHNYFDEGMCKLTAENRHVIVHDLFYLRVQLCNKHQRQLTERRDG